MKNFLFTTVLALGGFAASQADAYTCTLESITSAPVPVGQEFGFAVLVSFVDVGPAPPLSYKPFEAVFHGTKDGVWDTGSGQHLMNVAGNHIEYLIATNPGGIAGNYLRFATIFLDGVLVCSTNSVSVVLQ